MEEDLRVAAVLVASVREVLVEAGLFAMEVGLVVGRTGRVWEVAFCRSAALGCA